LLVARSELSYYPIETLEVKEKPIKEIKKSTNRKKSCIPKLVYLAFPVVILGISLSVLFGYAKITAVRLDITKLESQKVELEKTKQDLIADLEGVKSSVKITEDAILKLGMNYPTEGQIVYISVNENSGEKIEKASIGRNLIKIFSMVTNLF
jgi:cell division protein FtsL